MLAVRHPRSWLLTCSLTLNVLILLLAGGYVAQKGGIGFLLRRVGLEKTTFHPEDWETRIEVFQSKLPVNSADTVFVGDSLTADAPYADYFTTIKKRGVGGETTAAILNRLDGLLQTHPAKLFLMVGTNDLCKDIRLDEIVDNYGQILDKTAHLSPGTCIYVIGVTPMNTSIQKPAYDPSADVPVLNKRIAALCAERDIPFIDPSPVLQDGSGVLKPEYTTDGLHLTAEGYARLIPLLAPYHPGQGRETTAGISPARSPLR